MRFSNAELGPFWGAAIRFFPASLLLFIAMAIWRVPMPRGVALTGALLYGALNFGASYALLYYGLLAAPGGTASVMVATIPVWTFVLALVHRIEAFRTRALVGAIVATLGIGVVFIEQLGTAVPPANLIALLAGAVVAAEAGVIAKKFPRTHPLSTNAVGMLVGALILFAISRAIAEPWVLPQRPETQIALLYLATVGAIGLFALFLFVLGRWTATAASYALVVAPLVAIAEGAALRGESISALFIVGGVVVAIGVYIGALSSAPARPPAS